MLQIKSISKQYKTGDLVQNALKDVSLNLRDNEFVSVLGPSGSGKTTLLNIIGGLDRYDSGDLIINGISTKKYTDRDWDAYRNHTIGFVFQSYNLIPHQSVLANVELALTIAGLGRAERRKRAKKALEEVGLGDQLHKRPNQMSGGQMQRVAIARALVNDPDILLADEPTGALDTETSVQVMELLKKVAENRLVVMVTHNPELAQQYSTRIVKLRDGSIVDDSDPYEPSRAEQPKNEHIGKAKMGFMTSLALSFNNLRTKKGRTLLTSFAGSIGIIGIALILALSTGVNTYIEDIQKETMTSYPITISAQTIDMTSIMGVRDEIIESRRGGMEGEERELDAVYADSTSMEMSEKFTSSIAENDLTAFKRYLDDEESEINQYIGENGVVYTYNVSFDVYSYDADGAIVDSDADTDDAASASAQGFSSVMSQTMLGSVLGGTIGSSSAQNFSELMAGSDGAAVSAVITDSYELIYGAWPKSYDEVVLVLGRSNTVQTATLYQLGLITAKEYTDIADAVDKGEAAPELKLDYADVCAHTFYLVPACDRYSENEDGTFTYIADDSIELEQLLDDALELKISGIIRPKEGANNATLTTAVAYTSALTDYVITHTNESAVVLAQQSDESINVLNGMEFEAATDEKKAEDAKAYISSLGVSQKASLYQMIMYYKASSTTADTDTAEADIPESTDIDPSAALGDMQAGEASNTQSGEMGDIDSSMLGTAGDGAAQLPSGMGMAQMGGMQTDESTMAAALDAWLEGSPDEEILVSFYDEYIRGASYEDNMEAFGKVSYSAPAGISIYTDSFEAKELVSDCITAYNETVDEDKQITYTDYVKLMTSSLTSIIDVISYVLIAFVAVSLVVSCIMIGIITHISVLERTKEIGILRALGASRRNISQVFNAETIIIGLCAGILGVGVTELLTLPINALFQKLVGMTTVSARLPLTSAIILVILSVAITVIGGLVPAEKAAKKDPVIALRTE